MESEYYNIIIQKEFSQSVKLFLEKHGDEEITNIEINKIPINYILFCFLNIWTNYKLHQNMKKLNYEKLFHLRINIKTKNGTYFSLEKQDIIKIEYNPPYEPQVENLLIPTIPKNLTTRKMIEKTKELIGNKIFFYSAKYYNCQDFIVDLLKINEMMSDDIFSFIKQDSKKLLEDIESILIFTDIVIGIYYLLKSLSCLFKKYWVSIIHYFIYLAGCIYIFTDFLVVIYAFIFS
jgi:hypothetical protein